MENKKPVHVVILGAGFGGVALFKELKAPHTRITLVDRTNHHLFQPLVEDGSLITAETKQSLCN
jgi:NADH dehydrogenase